MSKTKHVVVYDGDCGFCRQSIKWLRWLDWRRAATTVSLTRVFSSDQRNISAAEGSGAVEEMAWLGALVTGT